MHSQELQLGWEDSQGAGVPCCDGKALRAEGKMKLLARPELPGLKSLGPRLTQRSTCDSA